MSEWRWWREKLSVRERERGGYGDVGLLQAPHFCQQWHLYLGNALLMPHHICCCKLLLRPILNDEEKESEMAVEAPRVIFNGDEKDFWHRFVLGVLLTLDHCFATFSPHTPHGLHPPCSCLRLSSSLHSSCLLCVCCHSFLTSASSPIKRLML